MKRKIIFVSIVCIINLFLFFFILKHVINPSLQGTQDILGTNPQTTATRPTVNETINANDNTQPQDTTSPETQGNTDPTSNTQAKPTEKPTTEPTVATTSPTKPTVKDEELPQWKTMYINYATIKKSHYDHYDRFALVYIDDDNIPELYMYGNNKAELCAVRGDAIISQFFTGVGGGNYDKKSGCFMNVYPENNYLVMRVYKLTDAFYQTFWGREDKTVDPPAYYIGNYTGAVSEAEFKAAVSEYINTDKTTFLHENALSFDEFVKYIKKSP